MLSAQKQQMPSNTQPKSSQAPMGSGFGKVLNSIQGLQQRLDDFSVEEVTRAHNIAHRLIQELDSLQAQLNALVNLQNAVFIIDTQVEAIPEYNFDLVAPDSLDKHPQLRAIVQAGKLIRMHRTLRAAQASADSASFDLQATLPGNDLSANRRQAVSDGSSQPADPIAEAAPPAPPQLASAADSDRTSAVGHQQAAVANFPSARDSQAQPTYDFSALKLEQMRQPASTPRATDSPHPGSSQKHAASRKGKKPKGKPEIDQRLLNDLIEAYGEFAISTKAAGSRAPENVAPAAAEGPDANSAVIVARQAAPAEPASMLPSGNGERLEVPPSKQEREEPILDGPPPSVKSQGEIDRQLKSIIKDYGEVDLYSHRKSINTKAVVIGAIAGLALVLGGFYFFRTPSVSPPAAIEATATSGATAVEAGDQSRSHKHVPK
jgi:hypothetical protein